MKAKRNKSKSKLKITPFIKQCCDCGNLFCVADGDILQEESDDTWKCKNCRINSAKTI